MDRPPRLLYVTSIAVTQFLFLAGQNRYMSDHGFELHAAASPGPYLDRLAERDDVTVHPVQITRSISPLSDLLAFARLTGIIRRVQPDIIHVSTPKAALIGAAAAWLCRTPVRLYYIRGLSSQGARGIKASSMRALERLTARLCNAWIAVSRSVLDYAQVYHIVAPGQGRVIAHGMSNGIDVSHFDPALSLPALTIDVPGDAVTIGFVGRLTPDKGIRELAEAWAHLCAEHANLHLLIVGPWENQHRLQPVLDVFKADARVHLTGFLEDVRPAYQAMDLFVYPSYREGFPNAPMEAAAMGLPVIVSDVVGNCEAVEHNQTGLIITPFDTGALIEAINRYLHHPDLAARHGQAGRTRVMAHFRNDLIWEGLHRDYQRLLATIHPGRQSWYTAWGKRLFDLLATVLLLIPALPLMAGTALTIWISMGRPVLYRSERPGLNGEPFAFLKFRTMTSDRDAAGNPLPDDQRLTPIGRILRSTSLDELPQLFNVLRGEMSLVGPRPLLMAYLPLYTEQQAHRHDVRPGITGWSQVNGRNALSWEEKFELDVWYVAHLSPGLDLRIMAQTALRVLRRSGINQPGHTTMSRFTGSRPGDNNE